MAEVPDEGAHQVRIGVLVLGPDPAQQRVEGHDPARVEREHAQQLVLGGGQVDRLAIDRHPALRVVDGERTEHERFRLGVPSERRPHLRSR